MDPQPQLQANLTPFYSNFDSNQYGNLYHLASETPEISLQMNVQECWYFKTRGILF